MSDQNPTQVAAPVSSILELGLPIFRRAVTLLALFVVVASCTTTSSTRLEKTEALLKEHEKMSKEGMGALEKFKRRIEPGISKNRVKNILKKLSKSPGWPEWRDSVSPDDKSFEVKSGKEIETWRYGFYRKDVYLTFESDKLVGFETRRGKNWIRMQKIIESRLY